MMKSLHFLGEQLFRLCHSLLICVGKDRPWFRSSHGLINSHELSVYTVLETASGGKNQRANSTKFLVLFVLCTENVESNVITVFFFFFKNFDTSEAQVRPPSVTSAASNCFRGWEV